MHRTLHTALFTTSGIGVGIILGIAFCGPDVSEAVKKAEDAAWAKAHDAAIKEERAKATDHMVGRYLLNNITGEVEFKYVDLRPFFNPTPPEVNVNPRSHSASNH